MRLPANWMSDRSLVESSFNSHMDEIFNDFFGKDTIGNFFNGVKSKTSYPKLDIYYKDDTYCIDLAVPGMQEQDLTVEFIEETPNKLKISGQKVYEEKSEKNNYVFKELRRGSFERVVSLPNDITKEPTTATLKDGILKLTWEKVKPKQLELKNNVKKISVNTG